MSREKTIGIYHENCRDGTTAGALLLKKYPSAVLFSLPRGYTSEDFEPILKKITREHIVYILDFDLYEKDTARLSHKAKHIINIDHHIGAKEMLESFEKKFKNFTLVFDNNHSGASLTWIHFWGKTSMPIFVTYVEAGDIGIKKYKEKKDYIGNLITPHVNNPQKVKKLLALPITVALKRGKIIFSFFDFLARFYVLETKPIVLKIGPYKITSYNATFNTEQLRSYIGHLLVLKHKKTIAMFRISNGMVRCSFYGENYTTPSGLTLAKILGGNGHRNAAGAQVPLKKFLRMVVA